jgi:hypothetical protein
MRVNMEKKTGWRRRDLITRVERMPGVIHLLC